MDKETYVVEYQTTTTKRFLIEIEGAEDKTEAAEIVRSHYDSGRGGNYRGEFTTITIRGKSQTIEAVVGSVKVKEEEQGL